MRAFLMLAALSGLGVTIAGAAMAEAKNLSCITDLAPNERRLLRDCGPEPTPPVYTIQIVDEAPPPSPPPALMHDRGRKSEGQGRDRGGNAGRGSAGGNAGAAGSAAN